MNVLHLPINIASQISTTVRGLRAVGIEARGLVSVWKGDVIQSHDEIEILPDAPERRSIRWATTQAYRYSKVMAAIRWADVLHWHFGGVLLRKGFDLRWARFLRKPGMAEFWGSDIRIAAVEAADNPYFARYAPRAYQAELTSERSRKTQSLFSEAGFDCLIACRSMLPYVQKDLFREIHVVRQRIMISDYSPRFPDPCEKRPVLVHTPSNPELKGTAIVLAAVEHLRSKLDFEFSPIRHLPRPEAFERVAQADIFLEQFVLGAHGLAALEAMAFGKPVVCFIKPSMVDQYPADLPIVNASPDNLAEVLEELIKDGKLRHELGLRGRAYVEKHHDAIKIAHQLKDLYQQLMDRRRNA